MGFFFKHQEQNLLKSKYILLFKTVFLDKFSLFLIFQPVRGRGAPPFRAARGGMPVGRGTRGSNRAGRGGVPARGARGGGSATQKAVRGGKRKAGTDFSQGQSKRRVVSDNWGAQPIAQQPLDQSNYGTGSGYTGNDAQWYQDSYGGNW